MVRGVTTSPFALIRQREGRLRSNPVCAMWIGIGLNCYLQDSAQVTGGGAYARAHVSTPFLYLKNGSADYVQIWRVDTNSFAKYTCFAHFLFGEKETHRK